MSIESLYTSINPQPGQSKSAGNSALPGSIGGLKGLNFLDIILGKIGQLGKEADAENDFPNSQSEDPLVNKEIKMEIAKLLAANPDIAENLENYVLSEDAAIGETLALNQQAFDEILKPVLSPKLAEELEDLITAKTGDIRFDEFGEKKLALLEKLLLNKNSIEGPGLITSDLTPEQLFDLKQQINDILNSPSTTKDDEHPAAGLFAAIIQLIPPQAQTKNNGLTNSNALTATADLSLKAQESTLAGRLNSLTPGAAHGEQNFGGLPEADIGEDGFEGVLKKATDGKKGENLITGSDIKSLSVKPDLSSIQGWTVLSSSGLTVPAGFVDDYAAMTPLTSVTNLSAFTELVTQAQHAARPHPATQMVAATVQKSALDGTSKEVVLQLDPPELGKLRINMEFGKNKTLKASIIAEKPETFMMLQRDAQTLERLLQDVGLDTEGGLSFELADHSDTFDKNGHHTKHSAGKSGGIDSDEEALSIETTMTWHVDPGTGHMRYNLMA